MSSLPLPRQSFVLASDSRSVARSRRRLLAVLAAVVLLHAGALVALRHLSPPTPATVDTPALTAVLIPLTPPAPAPAMPAPRTLKPPPAKPHVPPPPPPKAQPKTAITPPKAQPAPEPTAMVAPPAPPAPAEPVAAASPAPAANAAAAAQAGPVGPVEGLKVSCDERKPVYPIQSARMGEEGTVTLRLVINERGVVDKVTVAQSSGSARLDQAAKDAAMAMRCRPPMANGKPVMAAATKPFTFRLDD